MGKTWNADNCMEIKRKTKKNLSQGIQPFERYSNYAHFEQKTEVLQHESTGAICHILSFVTGLSILDHCS